MVTSKSLHLKTPTQGVVGGGVFAAASEDASAPEPAGEGNSSSSSDEGSDRSSGRGAGAATAGAAKPRRRPHVRWMEAASEDDWDGGGVADQGGVETDGGDAVSAMAAKQEQKQQQQEELEQKQKQEPEPEQEREAHSRLGEATSHRESLGGGRVGVKAPPQPPGANSSNVRSIGGSGGGEPALQLHANVSMPVAVAAVRTHDLVASGGGCAAAGAGDDGAQPFPSSPFSPPSSSSSSSSPKARDHHQPTGHEKKGGDTTRSPPSPSSLSDGLLTGGRVGGGGGAATAPSASEAEDDLGFFGGTARLALSPDAMLRRPLHPALAPPSFRAFGADAHADADARGWVTLLAAGSAGGSVVCGGDGGRQGGGGDGDGDSGGSDGDGDSGRDGGQGGRGVGRVGGLGGEGEPVTAAAEAVAAAMRDVAAVLPPTTVLESCLLAPLRDHCRVASSSCLEVFVEDLGIVKLAGLFVR